MGLKGQNASPLKRFRAAKKTAGVTKGTDSKASSSKSADAITDSIINDVLRLPELRVDVFSFIAEKKKKIEQRNDVGYDGDLLPENTTFKTLPEDMKIAIITKHSDLAESDIKTILLNDPEGFDEMFQWGLQMPMKTRLPVQFLVKPVCSLFITARFLECGSRLESCSG